MPGQTEMSPKCQGRQEMSHKYQGRWRYHLNARADVVYKVGSGLETRGKGRGWWPGTQEGQWFGKQGGGRGGLWSRRLKGMT